MIKFLRLKSGFTLVEVLLYFAVVGSFLFAAMMFSFHILGAFKLSENFHDIQSTSMFSLQKITYAIQSADSVDDLNSVFDDGDGVLALNGNTNVSFYLKDDDLFVKEGEDNEIQLNPDNIIVTLLQFHKIEGNKTPPQIVIDGQFESVSEIAGTSRVYPFHLSVSLRKL